ncbi:hypothetical protein [Portibacter marinus]|uniref:hypothetical protein n=1 Tax=Portibacter marinus TaxID=2898660 RepID=UPI001F2E7C47|nr:hypothetical protein [Portibacter marinus]
MRLYLLIFLAFSIFRLNGQEKYDISFWSDVMINANVAEHRSIAVKNFRAAFDDIIAAGDAFNFDFTQTPELSVLSDSLETFKLVTWQVRAEGDQYDYYGYLIKKDGPSFVLDDEFSALEDIEYMTLGPSDWLGGIYYNLIEQDGKYFVFSFRQLDEYTKFKSFDVLTFDEEGAPVLGEEVFVKPMNESRDILKNRVIFTYSADAILSLNYNPAMNMVVHDHLMEVMGQREGQGPTKVPDGTYEGYVFQEGQWVYQEKLFSHTYDEAPRPNQILGKSERDVFGKEKKN